MGFPREFAKWAFSKHPKGAKVALAGTLALGGYVGYDAISDAVESHRQSDPRMAAASLIDRGLCRIVILGPETPLRYAPVVDNQASSEKAGNTVGKVEGFVGVRIPLASSKRPNWIAYVPKDAVTGKMSKEDIAASAIWTYYDQSKSGETNPLSVSILKDAYGNPIKPQECASMADELGHFPLKIDAKADNALFMGGKPVNLGVVGVGFETNQEHIDFADSLLSGVSRPE